jgi:hypothetical protein
MIDEIRKSYFMQSIGNRRSKRSNRQDSSRQALPVRNLLSSYTISGGVRNELGSYTQNSMKCQIKQQIIMRLMNEMDQM